MVDPLDEKIRRLNAEFVVAKQAQELWKILQDKRSQLESKLSTLQEELERETQEYHKYAANNVEKGKALEQKTAFLQQIKKSQQEVDDQIDKYEEFSHEMVAALQEELVEALLQKHPHQRPHYEDLVAEQNLKKKTVAHIERLCSALLEISRLLDQAAQERKKASPKGLFGFLFGHNPALLITKNLKAAGIIAERGEKLIKEGLILFPEPSPARELWLQSAQLLVQLKSFTSERWNYKKLDTVFSPINERLKRIIQAILNLQERTLGELNETDHKIHLWIKKDIHLPPLPGDE